LTAAAATALQVSKTGAKAFKKFVKEKGGALPTCLAFWVAAHHFKSMAPGDEEFTKDMKFIYKK